MAGKRAPWDRLDEETDEAWPPFVAYREMGTDRTLTAVATETGYSRRQCAEFSRKYGWVQRVRAWDRRKDQAATRGELHAIERMHARHVALSLQLQDLTGIELARAIRLAEKRLETDDDSETIDPRHLARTLKDAVHVERLSRGEPTEKVAAEFDLSKLSVEDLRELKRLRAKMGADTEGESDDPTD